jgi:hypothetical protein
MVPGLGYMYKTTNPLSTFVYPNAGFKSDAIHGNGYEPIKVNNWILNEADYQYNMSVVASLNIPKEMNISQNNAIGVFADNICVGIAKPTIIDNQILYFLTIYGENNKNLNFKVVDLDNNTSYNIIETLNFVRDNISGNLHNPFVLNLIQTTSSIEASNEANVFSISSYPIPFSKNLAITYSIAENCNVTIDIFDILGRKINSIVNQEVKKGVYTYNYDGSNLNSGVYLIKISAGSYTETINIIKK